MKMKTALISIVVCIIPISLFSAEYSLQDVFNAALQNSEKIQYSMENLNIARIGKSKSLSVLIPRIVGYGTYVEYSKRQYDDYGYETLSLGLREFTALSMADTGIKKSSLDLDNTKEEFLLQVARAYFDTLKAEKQVEIARANLERLNKYKDMAEKRLKVGEITKTVLLRAQGELSGAQSDMVNAENAVNLIRAVLVRLTGIETDFKIKDQPVQDKELEGLQVLKDSAYENRSDLKSLEYMKKLALQQKSYAIGSYFPNITLSALYQRTDQSPGDINKVPETASIAAGFNFPLFVGGYRKADVDEAKAKYRQAELLYEDLKKNVSVEVETAWLEVNTQKQVIVFLTDQVSFARNNFFSITRQFEMGLASSIDVLDANTLLLTSERKLANELYALQIAQLRLKRSTGTLLRDSN